MLRRYKEGAANKHNSPAFAALRLMPIRRKLKSPLIIGAWLSLARAPGSGPGGRWFKSTRPDHSKLGPLNFFEHSLEVVRKGRVHSWKVAGGTRRYEKDG